MLFFSAESSSVAEPLRDMTSGDHVMRMGVRRWEETPTPFSRHKTRTEHRELEQGTKKKRKAELLRSLSVRSPNRGGCPTPRPTPEVGPRGGYIGGWVVQ